MDTSSTSSRAYATFERACGTPITLCPGDIIGRLRSAALYIEDPAVSEAHSMLTVRGGALKLLALRGRFSLDGQRIVDQVVLARGQRIWLSRETSIGVLNLAMPDTILGIEGDQVPRQALGGTVSIETAPAWRLLPRFVGHAALHIWWGGDGWLLRERGGQPRSVAAGDELSLDGRRLRFVTIALAAAAGDATQQGGGLRCPLRVVYRYDTVHIHRGSAPVAVISGLGARLLSELMAMDAPAPWRVLAAELWPDDPEPGRLRKRLDMTVGRLRRRLRALGVRDNLVRNDGRGNLEVVRCTGDRFEDKT